MKTYLDQLRYVLEHGVQGDDRTGVGTLSTFGLHARYDLAEGFPAVTTKKLAWNVMASELLWFISGSDNINDLKAIYAKNKIWDANYTDYLKRLGLDANDGSMGRIYGTQWRRWRGADGQETDQLAERPSRSSRTTLTQGASWLTRGTRQKLEAILSPYRPATRSFSFMLRAVDCLYRCTSDQQICFLGFPLTSRATRSCYTWLHSSVT